MSLFPLLANLEVLILFSLFIHEHVHFNFTFSSFPLVFCHLFTHCKCLQVLNVKCCSLIDDVAIITLVQNCSFLSSLCLSGCYTISDRSVVAVAQRSKYIQALDLSRTKVRLYSIEVCSESKNG